MAINGATDPKVFRTDVKQVLGPTLPPGDIVVRDNVSALKVVEDDRRSGAMEENTWQSSGGYPPLGDGF
jgi:hypothetical protein